MKLSKVIKRTLIRALYPGRIWKAVRIQKKSKRAERVYDDTQLQFYSKILKGDFLHYGYFEDINTRPEDISITNIEQAQLKYAQLFLEQIIDKSSPVIDVGCGMGGLSSLLLNNGFLPYALTPDKNQIHYIKNKYKNIPIVECKFEDIDIIKYPYCFGTLITSESIQYLDLEKSLKIIDKILKPNGKWLVCDYFKKESSFEKSGHNWEYFLQIIKEFGWKITYEKDITLNVLVTLKYINMLATRLGVPLADFILGKFQAKQPGLHYLTKEIIDSLTGSFEKNLEITNPDRFLAEKKYIFMVLEKK